MEMCPAFEWARREHFLQHQSLNAAQITALANSDENPFKDRRHYSIPEVAAYLMACRNGDVEGREKYEHPGEGGTQA